MTPVPRHPPPGSPRPPGAARQPRREGSAEGEPRIRSGRLAGLTMGRAVWVLSTPILAQSFLNSLVGLTDTVLAANVSEAATDAIGGASYILWFVGLVISAVGVGATALISRAIGAGRTAVANAALGQSILLSLAASVVVASVLVAGCGATASMLNLNAEARRAFIVFTLITALGVPVTAVLNAGVECARAAGDSFRPLRAMVAVNVINMAASWALAGVDITHATAGAALGPDGSAAIRTVLHNPFPFHLGVAGIAWGTVIAEAVGAAMVLRLLVKGDAGITLRRRRLRPHGHTIRRLLRVGLTNFLETFGMWIANFMVIIMVGWMSATGTGGGGAGSGVGAGVGEGGRHAGGLLGAHILAVRIESFSYLPGFAMGAAAATLAGQYLGAGAPRLARRAILTCTGAASAFMGLMGVLFVAFPEQVVALFSAQPLHLALTPALIRVTGFVQVPFAVSNVLRFALRGAGDVRPVMWLTWISTYGVRLPLAYLLSGVEIPWGGGTIPNPSPFHGGLAGLWAGLCLELVIRAALFTARFLQGGWTKARV